MKDPKREPLELRYMVLEDLDAVMEIEKSSFASPWSRRSFEAEIALNRPYSHSLVAILDKRIVGFICFQYVVSDAHIINLAVHPDYRRRGIGRQLLKHALRCGYKLGVERMVLEVRVSNQPAFELYRQSGFRILGVRRRFYSDNGEDAYVMVLSNLQRR